MRFGHTSTLSLLSTAGLAWALGWGCASKDSGSTFAGTSGGDSTGSNAGSTTSTTSGSSGSLTSGSGTTSGSTTITPPATTSGGSGGSGGLDPDASCGQTRSGTKQIPIDVFIMQDKSGSMECASTDDACENPGTTPQTPPSRWTAMGTALGQFVDSPAPAMTGVAIGLGFFGLQDGSVPCQANSYQTPVVPIMPLPANATPIKNAIMATMPSGGTPTAPALQGAIAYARQYTMQQMGMRTAAVLLVTDGNPTGCNQNGVTQAVAAAQAGYMGTPQIKTFVVGMGNTAALSQVALAGSGGMQDYIPTMGDVVGTLTKALSTITGMITCNYAIPAGSDPRLVNVEITVGAGMSTKIGKVDNAAACGMLGGWYYDNNTTPTQIILCPQSCDPLKATPNSGVQVLYGCPSVPPA